jgi:hypothetical protein
MKELREKLDLAQMEPTNHTLANLKAVMKRIEDWPIMQALDTGDL